MSCSEEDEEQLGRFIHEVDNEHNEIIARLDRIEEELKRLTIDLDKED